MTGTHQSTDPSAQGLKERDWYAFHEHMQQQFRERIDYIQHLQTPIEKWKDIIGEEFEHAKTTL